MKATEINGIEYFTVSQILKELGIARQTLWRWRQQEKIPAGHRYRDRNLLYTSDEVEEIRQFANRVEDLGLANKNQLRLFNLK